MILSQLAIYMPAQGSRYGHFQCLGVIFSDEYSSHKLSWSCTSELGLHQNVSIEPNYISNDLALEKTLCNCTLNHFVIAIKSSSISKESFLWIGVLYINLSH